jgi:2-polyprenyl-3-methyl-5-hydroxy-6-metoxy-1,4-benzoquinol methylase
MQPNEPANLERDQHMTRLFCPICSRHAPAAVVQRSTVHSNVRAFRQHEYEIWRCSHCRSINAATEVDLPFYYAHYPFHVLADDIRLSIVHGKLLRRLRSAGLRKSSTFLDYGCGSGAFVRHLHRHGYAKAVGYDEFNPQLAGKERLADHYDFVLAQDVLEHAEQPLELLARLNALARPGGMIAIGTPDAEQIQLERAQDFIHTLHAPYHRHIFSRAALELAARAQGWRFERRYKTMYTNTCVPFLNEAFYRYYMGLFDDTLEALFGPVHGVALLRNLPRVLWVAFFGALASRHTDPMSLFRKP